MTTLRGRYEKGIRAWGLVRQARAEIAAARRERVRTGAPVLVTCLAQMGDVVMSAGVVAALRARFPDAPLLFAGQPPWLEILEGDPAVDGLLGARALFEVRALARAGLFETVYVLDIPIPDLLHYLDGLPNIHRYAPPTTADWFERGEKLMTLYERNAGLDAGEAVSRVWVRPEDERFAQTLWGEQGLNGRDVAGPVIALHTQSSMDSKNWPLDCWAALMDAWRVRHGARFVIVGGPGEAEPLRCLPSVTHLAGRLSLKQTAAVIARCDLFAGLDSGLAYIAEAVRTPGLVVLGSTVAETSGPRWDGIGYVRAPDACLPACHRVCTRQPLCVTHLGVAAVNRALESVWQSRRVAEEQGAVCAFP